MGGRTGKKAKAGGRGKGKQTAAQESLGGAQALELNQALQAGEQLDNAPLLKLLKSDTACEGLYSKTCKVCCVH